MVVRKIFTLLIFVFSVAALRGQDIHFSLYDFAPVSINPAETGFFEGKWRAAINYRQQWKAIAKPFQTIAATYDQNLNALPGNFSAGIVFLNDRSGLIGLNNNRAYLSLGYKFTRAEWTYSLGVQTGYVLKSYSLSGITFPEQYNDQIGLFDPNLPFTESNMNDQTGYFDLNLGVLFHRNFLTGKITGGFSVMHLNNPNVSFIEEEERLQERYTGYARYTKDFSNDVFVRPSAIFSLHNRSQEVIFGSDVGMYFTATEKGVDEAFIGLEMRNGIERNGDAFIVSGGFAIDNFLFGAAYDINYSNLETATNNRGAFEISVIYINPVSALKKITIPCDRL